MEELVRLLLEEADNEDRSLWYESGYDAEGAALNALRNVLRRVQYRLEGEK